MAGNTLSKTVIPLEDPFYKTFRDWFANEAVLQAIEQAALETLEWLRGNQYSIYADGRQVVEPWFDKTAFGAPLPNEMAEGERHYTLEIKAYEHGVGYFLKRLSELEVYDIDYEKGAELVFIRSAELNAWLRYLVRNSWAGISLNLKGFKDAGDFSPNAPSAHARKKLQNASALGIALVEQPNGPQSYSITAGPVAKVFYENVWYPITTELRSNIAKWSDQ